MTSAVESPFQPHSIQSCPGASRNCAGGGEFLVSRVVSLSSRRQPLSLPSNFFDKKPPDTSASLSGREHAVEGFFDTTSASLSGREHAVEGFFDEQPRKKRPRQDVEVEQEQDEMEEADENEGVNIDKMLDEAEAVEVMDLSALRRSIAALERKISKNQELRIKHADDPQKFMESEVELFEEINKLQALATAPDLYVEFVRLNGVQKMSELLDHENNDITLATVELIHELTDPDALDDEPGEEGAKALVAALVDNALPELLIKTLAKMDESDSEQQQGVFKVLAIIENLSELSPAVLEALCERTEIISWLLTRLQAKAFDQNKLYASEVLSILMQNSESNQQKLGQSEGMDKLLALTAAWKRKDPKDTEEAELVQNIFNVICSALLQAKNQKALVDGEGIELMVIMLQARKFSARAALKVLDYAMNRNTNACERFVSALGLKTIFPGFLKPSTIVASKSKEAKMSGSVKEDEEHVVSIIASLLLRLSGEQHTRVLNKFFENDYEKLDKLMELHEKYHSQVSEVKEEEEEDDDEEEEDGESDEDKAKRLAARRYVRRLDRGLFTLQQVDTVITLLLAEDIAEVSKRVRMLMNQMDTDMKQLIDVIQEYHENVGDGASEAETAGDGLNMKEVTADLLVYLKDVSSSF